MKKATLFLILGIICQTSLSQNLLTNPSFENWTGGIPDGWTIVYPLNGTTSENTTTVVNSSKSLKVTGGSGTYTINQVVPVTAGKTYHLQMRYYIEAGDGTDARIWCNFKNSSGIYWKMNLADSLALKGPNWASTPGYFSDVRGAWQTYTYDVVAPVGYEYLSFEFRTYRSPAVVYWDDMSFSELVSEITTSTDQLSGFQYAPGAGPSAQQQFTVSGVGLTSGITITAPANYEISALGGVDFGGTNSMTIPASSGSVSPLTLYVRLKSGLSENTYTGNITVSSTGFTTKNIALSGKVEAPPSVVTLSTTALDNFQYTYGSGPSTEKSFTLSGSGLTSGIAISVPANFELSALSGAAFTGTNSINIPHSNGSINNLTLYVRLKGGLSVNTYTGDMTFTTNGTTTKSIALSGSVDAAPVVLNKSTSLLSGFTYGFGNGPSISQTFTIDGTGLTGNVTLTAPINYEISSDFAVSFSNSVSFTPSGGTLTSKTIYVRLKAGLDATTYTGSISISTTGTTTQTINLSGSVTLPAGISISTTNISELDYVAENGPSAIKSFVVYGGSLSSFLIITAPANFEISTSGGVDFSATGQILLMPSNGLVNAVTVYVRLKAGLAVDSYTGNILLSSPNQTNKYIALTGSVTLPPNVLRDNAYYEPRNSGKLTLSNKWLFSRNLNNYNYAKDFIAPSGTARGMAVKSGKMLFIDRSLKRIISVSGSTGIKTDSLILANNLFTYLGRNKANTADSTWTAGTFGYNDIKVDNAGNVLVGNMVTNNSGRFQVWKVNMNDGTGSLVIDQSNLATLFPAATTMRFDYFNVLGDVNTNAIIMAANGSITAMEVYKWVITNGVADNPTVIKLDNSAGTGKDLAGLLNLGSGPQIFPISENVFYIDGNATYPVLCDMNGNVLEGFKSNLYNLKDSVTMPGMMWSMNTGHNGMKEFQVGNEYFMVMAASNTASSPPSTFRLFKFADANKSFASMQCLWTFPQQGMGAASNVYRTAMPAVEVNGNTAKIYVYVGENGYGMYELTTDGTYTGTDSQKTASEKLIVIYNNRRLLLSEKVKQFELYNIAGQLISRNTNVSEIGLNLLKGVYIVRFMSESGAKQSVKFIVE